MVVQLHCWCVCGGYLYSRYPNMFKYERHLDPRLLEGISGNARVIIFWGWQDDPARQLKRARVAGSRPKKKPSY